MRTLGALAWFVVAALLLRSTALTALGTRGIVFDVLAFATVVWSLRHGASWGATFGFALGLAADLDAVHWIGRHALILTLIGYAIGRLRATLVRDSARTHAVLIALGTLAHQVWVLAFEASDPAGWPYLLRHVALALAVTAPIGTILLAMIRRVSGSILTEHVFAQSGSTS
jgi:rod shape-determining protein MreD